MKEKVLVYTTDIILFDIVGYSTFSNEKQYAMVNFLTKLFKQTLGILTAAPLLDEKDLILAFISTGDGFYVILQPPFSGYGMLLAIAFRNRFLKAQLPSEAVMGLRAAVHLGTAIPFIDITNSKNFLGDGLNDCSRMLCEETKEWAKKPAFSSDLNFVVISEEAFDYFEKCIPSVPREEFLSSVQFKKSPLFKVADKHGKKHKIQVVDCNRSVAFEAPFPPDYQERAKRFDEELDRAESTRNSPPIHPENHELPGSPPKA